MRLSRLRIALLVVLAIALVLVVVFATCRRKHVYFHEWHEASGTWGFVLARDGVSNQVVLDEPTNSLLVVLEGRGFGMANRGGPVVKIGMDVRYRKSFAGFENDLLIGAADLEIHEFKLPEGAAKAVFSAVWEDRCEDVRPLLLEVYRGPHREALRQVLGLDEYGAQTQPATTAPSGP